MPRFASNARDGVMQEMGSGLKYKPPKRPSGISMTDLANELVLTLSRISQLIARKEKVVQTTAG